MADDAPKRTRDRKDYVQKAHAAMERTIERSESMDDEPGKGSLKLTWHPITKAQRTTDRSRDTDTLQTRPRVDG